MKTILVSVCHARDFPVFLAFRDYITSFVSADEFYLVVNDRAVSLFKSFSGLFIVLSESSVISKSRQNFLRINLPAALPYGWYLQQMLKLQFVFDLPKNCRFIIWDIDTCPTSPLPLFAKDGRPILTKSSESHEPYLVTIASLYGLSRLPPHPYSFISQYLSSPQSVAASLRDALLSSSSDWLEPVVLSILNSHSNQRFSEYELLGYHLTFHSSISIIFSNYSWDRRMGRSFTGPISLLLGIRSHVALASENGVRYFSVERRDYRGWTKYHDFLYSAAVSFLSAFFECLSIPAFIFNRLARIARFSWCAPL
jgi:hypothetical protein